MLLQNRPLMTSIMALRTDSCFHENCCEEIRELPLNDSDSRQTKPLDGSGQVWFSNSSSYI